MAQRFPALNPTFPVLLHGGDYNPDQWQKFPEVLSEDLRLMTLAGANALSVGIFAWAALEPEEGRFTFDWLDRTMDSLERNGQKVILATPSGAKPNWMAAKYPEIRRVNDQGRRDLQQSRHNHCYTSPVYREKVTIMNSKLAERYAKHPALIMWHVSNEYGGDCHCPLCLAAFREFLKAKYKTVDALNDAYWARFWSHTFTAWEQIEALDSSVHGLKLDWMRFITRQTTDFLDHEARPLRKFTPNIPITINMMGTYYFLNYPAMANHIDIVSWDSYPSWHEWDHDTNVAMSTAFTHDLNRGIKQKPFLLMESTPSAVNWAGVSVPKRPNLHRTASLQAIAHGSDGVLYFQWRKSRGSSEKFHGAVVDHVGHENTRVFREVAKLGGDLSKLSNGPANGVMGMDTPAEVALLFDWEVRWAIDFAQGPRNQDKNYEPTVQQHYRPFWNRGIPVDVLDSTRDISRYKLVIAPMLYMLRPGVADRLKAFVAAGGTLVSTYLTGIVDENDLVHLGGLPGEGLMDLFGIWAEEIDVLPQWMKQSVEAVADNPLDLAGSFAARHYAEVLHLRGATPIATYTKEYYAGTPAVTVHKHGKGRAIYIASRNDDAFTDALIASLIQQHAIRPTLSAPLPPGVSATYRTDAQHDYVFVMNLTTDEKSVPLDAHPYQDALTLAPVSGPLNLASYETRVLIRPSRK